MARRSLPRPVISAPLGPVKSSRGPDLVRGKDLELVESIKDCESASSTPPSSSIASRRSRRVSASFLHSVAPSTSPVVAESDVTAVTRIESIKGRKASSGRRAALFSLSTRSLLRQPSRYTLVTQADSIEDEENIAPLGENDEKSSITAFAHGAMSKLPKSKTMTVLHGLKKSFSRPSLAAVMNSGFENKITMTPSKLSTVGTINDQVPSPLTLSSSETTPTPSSEVGHSSFQSTLHTDNKYIDAAQSSEYWSGRFMALNDRFLSENLTDDSLSLYPSRVDNHWQAPKFAALGRQSLIPSRDRLTYLAPSNTTSALTTITYNPKRRIADQENLRRRRIFNYLDSLCRTVEAKNSLRSWQKTYAQRLGYPEVVFGGDSPGSQDRKLVALGSVGSCFKNGGGRSMAFINELPSPRTPTFRLKLAAGRGVPVC